MDNYKFINSENKVSNQVIKRLPRYYGILKDLENKGEVKVSSSQLARLAGTTASQIRQDFSVFGAFGQQGFGYSIENLITGINDIIGIKLQHKAILVGAGNIGKALLNHLDFSANGFNLVGAFDTSPELIGTTVNEIKIRPLSELESFCRINGVHTAVICVPKEAAIELVSKLYDINVYNFLNFSDYDIKMAYPDANVETVRLGNSLMCLCYMVTNFR
ncbi:MAG: redox-sensing transcriptional repressor Rex [Clostridiales bacterium]|nr:redox-sensing transcriptional repressor Rex [Clostridiales bacterium]